METKTIQEAVNLIKSIGYGVYDRSYAFYYLPKPLENEEPHSLIQPYKHNPR